MDKELIFGIHSIAEALTNSKRQNLALFVTDKGWDELRKRVPFKLQDRAEVTKLDGHKLQEKAKDFCAKLGQEYRRVPSGAFLLTDPLPTEDVGSLYQRMQNGESLKVVALDRVTDAHNAAAILRTAAFYGIDALVVAQKGSFRPAAGAYRIASGAFEHLPLVRTPSLPKFIDRFEENGGLCLGLSEHAEGELPASYEQRSICLVLGAEDEGLSHAVMRKLAFTVALPAQGPIKSLNVSVAAAVAMEKIFGKKG